MVPLVLVLVACLGMRPALADWNDGGAWNVEDSDMGFKWGPTSVGDDRKGFVMVSDNRYNACLMVCGISINDERLTADAKAKLSNADTGGGFYLLAQRFGQYGDGNLPDWAKPSGVVVPGVGVGIDNGSLTANSAIRTCAAMYGKDATWWGDYTELERTNALKDLVAVLNGDGGGSDPTQGSTIDFVGNWYLWNGATNSFAHDRVTGHNFSNCATNYYRWHFTNPFTVTVNTANLSDFFRQYPYPEYDYYIALKLGTSSRYYLNTYIIAGKPNVFYKNNTYIDNFSYISGIVGDLHYQYMSSSDTEYNLHLTSDTTCDSISVTRNFYNGINSTQCFRDSKTFDNANLPSGWIDVDFIAPLKSPIPPTQWPDSPTYEPPTAPDVPDPTEPTVPSEPSAPTPVEPVQPEPSGPGQNPVYIEQPTYVDNTFTADLQGILDALDEHCKHLQDALYANISGLYSNLATKLTNDLTNLKSFLHGEYGWLNNARHNDAVTTWDYLKQLFSWLGGLVSDNFYGLNQHLTQLFNWLAEQFDFSFTGTGYNDDTVVSWLKKIYSKLGTGMNTRPNDPVAEPDSFGDWLTRLLQNFIGDLLSVGQEAVGGLVNDFQQLATKFPFCVPWDIAALLALFVAEPVAPVFDLPAYTITQDGLSQVSTYHISLADYNVAWEAVRFAEKVGFAVFLAWNTTHFREFLSGRGES